MSALLVLIALLAPAAAAAEGCALADLETDLQAALAAYGEMDQAGFDDAMDQAAVVLGCLADPVPPGTAARLQRLQGLRLLALDREPLARGAFAAARRIGPDPAFEATLGPRPRAAYGALDPEGGETVAVAPPATGELRFDGTGGTERPAAWPVLVQHVGEDGAVAFTRYLLPDAPLPAYAALAPPPRGRAALLSSAGLGVVAAGLLAGSALTFRRYQDPANGLGIGELDALQATNTALFWSGVSAGALAAGAGTVGLSLRLGGR